MGDSLCFNIPDSSTDISPFTGDAHLIARATFEARLTLQETLRYPLDDFPQDLKT